MYRLVATNGDGSGEGIDEAIGFGVRSFDGEVLDEFGVFENQAGAHPHSAYTEFFTTTTIDPTSTPPFRQRHRVVGRRPQGRARQTAAGRRRQPPGRAHLHPGAALPTTADARPRAQSAPPSSGSTAPTGSAPASPPAARPASTTWRSPTARPALLGLQRRPASSRRSTPSVRTGEDYGVDVQAKNAPQTLPIAGVDDHRLGRAGRPQPRRQTLLRLTRRLPLERAAETLLHPADLLHRLRRHPRRAGAHRPHGHGLGGRRGQRQLPLPRQRRHPGRRRGLQPLTYTGPTEPTHRGAADDHGRRRALGPRRRPQNPPERRSDRPRHRPPQRHDRDPARGPGRQPLRRQRPRRLLAGRVRLHLHRPRRHDPHHAGPGRPAPTPPSWRASR